MIGNQKQIPLINKNVILDYQSMGFEESVIIQAWIKCKGKEEQLIDAILQIQEESNQIALQQIQAQNMQNMASHQKAQSGFYLDQDLDSINQQFNLMKESLIVGVQLGKPDSMIAFYQNQKLEIYPQLDDQSHQTLINPSIKEISMAESFKAIKQRIENQSNKIVKEIVLTVPYFMFSQKEDIINACKDAKLKILEILSNPAANAIAITEQVQGNILIFDLWGQNLEVSIVNIDVEKNNLKIIEVLSQEYNNSISDIDDIIAKYLANRFYIESAIDILNNPNCMQILRKESEKIRNGLKNNTLYKNTINNFQDGQPLNAKVDIQFYEKILKDKKIDTQCQQLIEKSLNDSKRKKNEIDEILLIGSYAQIHFVQKCIKQFFDPKNIKTTIFPDSSARGAAIYANNINQFKIIPFTHINDVQMIQSQPQTQTEPQNQDQDVQMIQSQPQTQTKPYNQDQVQIPDSIIIDLNDEQHDIYVNFMNDFIDQIEKNKNVSIKLTQSKYTKKFIIEISEISGQQKQKLHQIKNTMQQKLNTLQKNNSHPKQKNNSHPKQITIPFTDFKLFMGFYFLLNENELKKELFKGWYFLLNENQLKEESYQLRKKLYDLQCEISPFIQSNEFGFYLNCKGTVDNQNEGHKKILNQKVKMIPEELQQCSESKIIAKIKINQKFLQDQTSKYKNFFYLSSYQINRVLKQTFSNNDQQQQFIQKYIQNNSYLQFYYQNYKNSNKDPIIPIIPKIKEISLNDLQYFVYTNLIIDFIDKISKNKNISIVLTQNKHTKFVIEICGKDSDKIKNEILQELEFYKDYDIEFHPKNKENKYQQDKQDNSDKKKILYIDNNSISIQIIQKVMQKWKQINPQFWSQFIKNFEENKDFKILLKKYSQDSFNFKIYSKENQIHQIIKDLQIKIDSLDIQEINNILNENINDTLIKKIQELRKQTLEEFSKEFNIIIFFYKWKTNLEIFGEKEYMVQAIEILKNISQNLINHKLYIKCRHNVIYQRFLEEKLFDKNKIIHKKEYDGFNRQIIFSIREDRIQDLINILSNNFQPNSQESLINQLNLLIISHLQKLENDLIINDSLSFQSKSYFKIIEEFLRENKISQKHDSIIYDQQSQSTQLDYQIQISYDHKHFFLVKGNIAKIKTDCLVSTISKSLEIDNIQLFQGVAKTIYEIAGQKYINEINQYKEEKESIQEGDMFMTSAGNLSNIKNIINFCSPVYDKPSDYHKKLGLVNQGISKIFEKCQNTGFRDFTLPILGGGAGYLQFPIVSKIIIDQICNRLFDTNQKKVKNVYLIENDSEKLNQLLKIFDDLQRPQQKFREIKFQWSWNNDKNQYEDYNDVFINSKIDQAYENFLLDKTQNILQFSFPPTKLPGTHIIDLKQMTITDKAKGTQKKLITNLNATCYTWGDQQLNSQISEFIVIQKQLKNYIFELFLNQYQIDFVKMIQTNEDTKFPRLIQKKESNLVNHQNFDSQNIIYKLSDKQVLFQFWDDEKRNNLRLNNKQVIIIEAYSQKSIDSVQQDIKNFIKNNTVTEEIEIPYFLDEIMKSIIDFVKDNCIDCIPNQNLYQGQLCQFSGLKILVNKLKFKIYDYKKNTPLVIYPNIWIWPKNENKNFDLVTLLPDSEEFQRICQMFNDTAKQNKISKIERIQNKFLYDNFESEKQKMLKDQQRYGYQPFENVKELWHGTGDTDPKLIFEAHSEAFDNTFAHDGMWGRGIYFAENASYSVMYRHTDLQKNKKVFILVKVALGYSTQLNPDQTLRRPPQRDSNDQMKGKYDSVQGVTGESNVFILYGNGVRRAYPAYRIEFD